MQMWCSPAEERFMRARSSALAAALPLAASSGPKFLQGKRSTSGHEFAADQKWCACWSVLASALHAVAPFGH